MESNLNVVKIRIYTVYESALPKKTHTQKQLLQVLFRQKALFLLRIYRAMMYFGILLFGISGGEILILLLLVLLLFGPKKIPEIARMIGKGMGEVKKVQREINSEIHRYSSEIERSTKEMDTGGDAHRKGSGNEVQSSDL